MDNEVVAVEVSHQDTDAGHGTVSSGLRYSSRKHRREILRSHGYHAMWLGEISREKYAELLKAHYWIYKNLEDIFDSFGDELVVKNRFFDDEKKFFTGAYECIKDKKSSLLFRDYVELMGAGTDDIEESNLPIKAQELISYTHKVHKMYSVALLGIQYMLNEAVCYAGPIVAAGLDKTLKLEGKACRYLLGDGNAKQDLWRFRKTLDRIVDFQTQANIIIASTLSYKIYRDLIDPLAGIANTFSDRAH